MQPVRARLSTEVRQAEIIGTVLDLSASVCPGDITTVDIARSLGLTRGAVFKHSPPTPAWGGGVLGGGAGHLGGALAAVGAGAPTPLEGLRAVFMKHARFVAKHPGVPRLILNELQKPRDTPVKRRARSMQENYRKLVVRLLAEAEKRGEVVAGLDRDGAATLFIGAVQGLMLQAMLAGSTSKLEAEAMRVFSIYLNAVRKPS